MNKSVMAATARSLTRRDDGIVLVGDLTSARDG